MIIGIDFDNTLVNYDDVFFQRALKSGVIDDRSALYKKQLRDKVRLLPDGELLWQQLQSYVYTKGMPQAQLIDGVKRFFISCKKADVRTYIVSHKTVYASGAFKEINLRNVALDWMEANGFFSPDVLGLNIDQVYFEPTRALKIERIKALGCTHFIDDLEEVFKENEFPERVEKILFAPRGGDTLNSGDMRVFKSWDGIYEYFFS
jgi:hypothetical protein